MALSVKRFASRVELYVSGQHTPNCHVSRKGFFTDKQKHGIQLAVRAAPLAHGRAVHAGIKNFSPGKHVANDQRSRLALNRLATRERKLIMSERVPGVTLDGSSGSMLTLAEKLDLSRFIHKHNDPSDPYHLDPHEVVTCGFQFEKGVTFMNFTTPHLLLNLPRAENCGWQKQLHGDATFNLCTKDVGVYGMGMNSMGSHYNPISWNIIGSESYEAIKNSYDASVTGMYRLFREVKTCGKEDCAACISIEEQRDCGRFDSLLKQTVDKPFFPVDKPSSDNSAAFHKFARKRFPKAPVQQCGKHLSGNVFCFLISMLCLL